MLTGVTTAERLATVPEELRPTVVAADASELLAALERMAASASEPAVRKSAPTG